MAAADRSSWEASQTSARDPFPTGVLCDAQIRALMAEGRLTAETPITEAQIQPASLDLRLGRRAYRVNAAFLPRTPPPERETGEKSPGRYTVSDHLADEKFCRYVLPLDAPEGAILDVGAVYVVPLLERLDLSGLPELRVKANPKSSLGRLDVLVRLLTEEGGRFDVVPPGYSGPLYAEISPLTFPIRVRLGDALTQIRFRQACHWLSDTSLAELHKKTPLVLDHTPVFDNGLVLHVNLQGSGPLAYEPIKFRSVVDLRRKDHREDEFWVSPPVLGDVTGKGGSLTLEPGVFYLLASQERIAIPPGYAAELAAFDESVGEFRVHYAGFFDPGFGMGGTPPGSRVVLEVRGRDVPFVLEHGQPIGRLHFEPLSGEPDRPYGAANLGSHYQHQDLRLSKHFHLG